MTTRRTAMDRYRLDGQVALVTGAGRGLGEGCAVALAEVGAEVVLMSRTESELQAVAAKIEADGGKARYVVCNVMDSAAVSAAIEGLERLNILVNNAGTNIPEPFLDVTEEHLDRILNLNVRSVFLTAQAAARKMMAAGNGGAIVNMSSQMGHVGAPNRTVYCASKHAVEGLTKAMGVELAPHKIRVNSVGPTFIETPLSLPFFDDPSFKSDVLDRIALGHMGQIEDVASAVVYLASPAASMVTGTSLLVDGGWTAR